MTREEANALEARFEASNADYREAKAGVNQALSLALVAGLLTAAFGVIRLLVVATSEPGTADPSPAFAAVLDVALGAMLVACFLLRARAVFAASATASVLWLVALVAPFVARPAVALLGIASPVGVAVTAVRLVILLVLARGVAAGARMRRIQAAAG